MEQHEGSAKMCNVKFNSFKVPTLKDELIQIQNNTEQRRLYYIIKQLKDAAMIGENHLYIYNFTENIKTYLKDQGLTIEEDSATQLYVTWG